MYLDIPNLQNVNLPNSFKIVHHPIVNSTILYCVLTIDVSELLFPKVYYFDFIQSIDSSITSIIIPNWTCNDADYTIFDFSRFSLVESIEIGNECFGSVQTFKIDGLNRLKTIKIGINSFSQLKSTDKWDWNKANNQSKSFHILNCESLESIQISTYWIVNHWNPFKLVNIVSVILLVNLNWRIYHNYNLFKLGPLEGIQTISMAVHLWFEVLIWYWIL